MVEFFFSHRILADLSNVQLTKAMGDKEIS
jgi:hypothetical protein